MTASRTHAQTLRQAHPAKYPSQEQRGLTNLEVKYLPGPHHPQRDPRAIDELQATNVNHKPTGRGPDHGLDELVDTAHVRNVKLADEPENRRSIVVRAQIERESRTRDPLSHQTLGSMRSSSEHDPEDRPGQTRRATPTSPDHRKPAGTTRGAPARQETARQRPQDWAPTWADPPRHDPSRERHRHAPLHVEVEHPPQRSKRPSVNAVPSRSPSMTRERAIRCQYT